MVTQSWLQSKYTYTVLLKAQSGRLPPNFEEEGILVSSKYFRQSKHIWCHTLSFLFVKRCPNWIMTNAKKMSPTNSTNSFSKTQSGLVLISICGKNLENNVMGCRWGYMREEVYKAGSQEGCDRHPGVHKGINRNTIPWELSLVHGGAPIL